MQLSLFKSDSIDCSISINEIFDAYYRCRSNKRNTANALAFEVDFESNLLELWKEINDNRYQIGRSIAFIVDKPVKREIFAADFRDRIVHHLIIGKLNPYFEKQFIYDSYACREGKGTHFGIRRVDRFIRQCSENYTKDCYILKLDVQGFFMHIDRDILYRRLRSFIMERYHAVDRGRVIELCHKVIYCDPARHCIIKGRRSDWDDLPRSKSLFHSPPGCGLPIGNLTSQVLANFYMDRFDHFIKHDLGIRYYGRYVDDFIIIHQDRDYLKGLISRIANFLDSELHLTLHPRKIHLQHYNKGVAFLGTFIKPGRIYIGRRTKGNFYQAIQQHNTIARDHRPSVVEQQAFLSSMNSYLGIMKHYRTYRLRKKMLWKHLSPYWWNHVYVSGGYQKLVRKVKRSGPAEKW